MRFRRIETALKQQRWDSSSPIIFLHRISWSFVRILTSNLESEQSGLNSNSETWWYRTESLIHSRWVSSEIYCTPKYHWDWSSINRYLIASLQLPIQASLLYMFFWWILMRSRDLWWRGLYKVTNKRSQNDNVCSDIRSKEQNWMIEMGDKFRYA